jgi:hypothetical protein
MCTTGISDTGGFNYSGGKFATGIKDIGDKFTTVVNDIRGK